MPNPAVYPNQPPKVTERYFDRTTPWHPNHGSDLYEQPDPTP